MDSVIYIMENLLFPLNSISALWLNPCFTTWAMDIILGFVCGLGLFLLLLPYLQGNRSFPPSRKKEKPKHSKVKKGQRKNRKKSGIVKGYRDCWREVEETKDLVSLLHNHLGKLHEDSTFHDVLHGDDPEEKCKPESDAVHPSRTLPVHDALATAFFALPSLSSVHKHHLLLPPTSSPELMMSSLSEGSHSPLSASQSPQSVIPLERHSPQSHGLSSPPSHPPENMASPPSLPCPELTSHCDPRTLSWVTTLQSSSSLNYLLPASVAVSSPVPLPSVILPSSIKLPAPVPLPSVDTLPSPLVGPPPVPLSPPEPWPPPLPSPSPVQYLSPVASPSPVPATSDHVPSTYPISIPSWSQMAATVCSLSHDQQSEAQRDHNSHPPEDSSSANHPLFQVEAEGISLTKVDVQKLPEISINKAEEQNICKDKTKNESDKPLNSLKSTPKSLGREQNITIPQSWNTKGKPQQLSFPHHHFYTNMLGDHLQEKCSQLFWGLPILHSESLVTTLSMSGASADFSSILFNEFPNYIPELGLTKPERLFDSQVLFHPVIQLQPVSPTLTCSQSTSMAHIQKQDHLTSSLTSMPFHLPLNTACDFSWQTSQQKTKLLSPSSLQHLEYHLCRKQLQCREALPSLVEKSQNVFCHVTLENRASYDLKTINNTPGDFLSLELEEKLEQHLQRRFMHHQYGLPPHIYQYLNLKESWDKVPRTGQEENNFGSSCTSMITHDCSPSVQGNCSERTEKFQKGKIPVGFGLPMCGTNHISTLPGMSNTHKKPGDGPSFKGEEGFRNSSQGHSLLDACTWHVLEAHVTSRSVRHRWGLPLKILKHMNLFKMKHSEASPHPQPPLPSSASCNSRADSIAQDTNVLGKSIHKVPGFKEVAKPSVPTLKCPLSDPSLESLRTNVSGNICGLSNAAPATEEGSLTSQPHSYILLGRNWHNDALLSSGRDTLEPSLSLEMGTQESLRTTGVSSKGSCHSLSSIGGGSQVLKAKEIKELEDDEEGSDWAVSMEIKETSNSPNIHNNLGNSESWGNSKTPTPCRSSISQDQGFSFQKAHTKPQNQIQGLATGVILQDYATEMFHEDCSSEVLLAADILASRERLSSSHCMSTSNVPSSQGLYGLLTSEESSQDLQEPQSLQLKDPGKCKTNKFRATAQRRERVWSRSKGQKQRFAGKRPSCAGEIGPSVPVMEVRDTVGEKSSQAPSKMHIGDRIKKFLQYIFPWRGKGQDNSLPKIMSPSTSTQSQRLVTSRLFTDNMTSEAQVLKNTVGWFIEQKRGFHHDPSASKKHMLKEETQAPVGRQAHYSRGSSSVDKTRVMEALTSGHQASPRGDSHPMNRWIRNDNNQALLLKESAPLASPCQHRHRVAGTSGHNVHCPRHCALQRHYLSIQHQHVSYSCPAGKRYSPQLRPY